MSRIAPRTNPWARALAEVACFAAPIALLAWPLRGALSTLGSGVWGPEQPWGNGDFAGNLWCWWREAERWGSGVEWLDATGWPVGGGVLDQLFPNRLDAWLALPSFELEHWWWTWNGMALVFVLLAVLATVGAARLAGASRPAAATAGMVLAMSPTFLHELGWGRMASFGIWPGVLAMLTLALALRAPRARLPWASVGASGLLLALQAVAYPFHGLAAGLACVAVLLAAGGPWARKARMLGVLATGCTLVGIPWLVLQASDFSAMAGAPPPAGYTSLPAAGLLGLPLVPERFRVLPLVLPLLLVALAHRRARPWALGGLLALGLALGPRIAWTLDGFDLPSPVAALMAASDWLARMHHPVRAAPVGLAAAAVAVALLLDPARDRLPGWRALGLTGLAALWIAGLATQAQVAMVTTWDRPVHPPGVEAARWLAEQGDGPVADVLSRGHMAGVLLQPWHRRPVLETVQGWGPASGGSWSDQQDRATSVVWRIADGGTMNPQNVDFLAEMGVEALLVVDRRGQHPEAPEPLPAIGALEEALGAPDYRDDEAAVWLLSPTSAR